MDPKIVIPWKKPDKKEHILCDSTYIISLNMQNIQTIQCTFLYFGSPKPEHPSFRGNPKFKKQKHPSVQYGN